MKKTLILALMAVVALSSAARADYALTFDDHNGTADAGTFTLGSTFSFDIYMTLAAGSTATGLSDWFQTSALAAPYVTITAVTLTPAVFDTKNSTTAPPYGFTTLQSNGQYADPTNLGGTRDPNSPLGTGTYLVGTISFTLSNSAAAQAALTGQSFTLSTTTLGTKATFVNGPGPTFSKNYVPSTSYTVNVAAVPEPSTVAFMLGGAGILAANLIRRSRKVSALHS